MKQFATAVKKRKLPLDTLILNAGVMKSPGAEFVGKKLHYGYEETADGFEMHIGTNHVGHQYLTALLKDTLKGRLISLTSLSEQFSYDEGMAYDMWRERTDRYEDGNAYGQSKLANILMVRHLTANKEAMGLEFDSYAVHPGVVKSALARHMEAEGILPKPVQKIFELLMLETDQGALATLFCAVKNAVPGGFYEPVNVLVKPRHKTGATVEQAKELWEKTNAFIADAGF